MGAARSIRAPPALVPFSEDAVITWVRFRLGAELADGMRFIQANLRRIPN